MLCGQGSSNRMLKISLNNDSPIKILCLGAHCDDIEIGCGGTIIKLVRTLPDVEIRWVVFSSDDRRGKEALKSSKDFLKDVKKKKIEINKFRNSFFPYHGAEIKEHFEKLKQEYNPDIIFTHYRKDLHQDHRLISELTWNSFRDHLILEYEIPKYDGDLGSPNFFVCLDDVICRIKTDKILEYFRSQHDKRWFTRDTFLSLLRLRGVESNAKEKYAEGFYCRKLII
jgi:LmbE family N-acetylglucosaminyl deacetylase